MITKIIRVKPEELQELVERRFNVKIVNMKLHGSTGLTANIE